MKLQINIEFNITEPQWQGIIDQYKEDLILSVERILAKHPNYKNLAEIELSMLLAGAEEIRKLNAQFRNKDKPTNILSFPEEEISPAEVLETTIEGDYIYLGDLALCYEVIRDEAKEKGVSMKAHLLHLFIHGILHLMGYNHTHDQEAEAMESLEIGILSQFGVKSPY